MTEMNLLIALFALIIYLINIPFGYWRANTRKLAIQWYLAIHLPVAGIILMRVFSDIGWSWISFIVFVLAFFLGQMSGAKLFLRQEKKHPDNTSSCLFMDLCRNLELCGK